MPTLVSFNQHVETRNRTMQNADLDVLRPWCDEGYTRETKPPASYPRKLQFSVHPKNTGSRHRIHRLIYNWLNHCHGCVRRRSGWSVYHPPSQNTLRWADRFLLRRENRPHLGPWPRKSSPPTENILIFLTAHPRPTLIIVALMPPSIFTSDKTPGKAPISSAHVKQLFYATKPL